VREGDETDIETFHEMLVATSSRQNFQCHSAQYYRQLWKALHADGMVRLFIVVDDGQPLAGQLVFQFAGTATVKMSAWSGAKGKLRPNEMLMWHSIVRAKADKCHTFDFDGIGPIAARAALSGQSLPEEAKQSVGSYKLGFGGQPVLLPPTHIRLFFPLATGLYCRIAGSPRAKAFLRRVKNLARTKR
jgi:hypothetical protein